LSGLKPALQTQGIFMSKLWGGRFAKQTDSLVHQFNASISFDVRLYDEDISGSMAWAGGLVGAGILTAAEAETIIAGLERVRDEFAAGLFEFAPDDEDVHTAVERRLTEIVGPVGGKLHTGRSRNDQVATDFRLWVRRACDEVQGWLAGLQQALIASAETNLNLPMPGYTHLQHAQPITWGHWALSHFWPLVRDRKRFAQVRAQAGVLPLGSGALAGTAFPIDRAALATELGFEAISQNSLDGVSDRDFAADFLYAAAMLGLHLSRLSEHLILFSSAEFGFVRLDDGYSTGSSLMPQKKNPDTLELTRGKSGRLIGNLMGLLTTLKGLPSTYDKDLQEDKEPVFDTFDTLGLALPVMTGLIRTLRLRPERMAAQLEPGLLATDLADYLVKKGMPFRQAHGVVGQVVALAEEKGVALTAVTLPQLQSISSYFEEDVTAVFQIKSALENRSVTGGTASQALHVQLQQAKEAVVRT
jgi:argininosuccinate lyase